MGRFGNAKWIAAAIIVAALVMPGGIAHAVTTQLVTIAGRTGTRTVGVSAANQLLTNDADTKTAVNIMGFSDTACATIYTVPAGKALVIKTTTWLLQFSLNDNPGDGGNTALWTPNSQGQCAGTLLAAASGDKVQGRQMTVTEDEGGEVIVPQNTDVKLGQAQIDDGVIVQILGYLIPASAAPAAPTVSHTAKRKSPLLSVG
jgi:hypothetical protein